MKNFLLLPCLLFALSSLCQTQPKTKPDRKTAQSNNLTKSSSQKVGLDRKKFKTAKKKITVSKSSDHLFDIKNEPE